MITVVGSVNVDLISRVAHLPVQGETIHASEFLRRPGGKGSNQAIAAARGGANVGLIARVGGDPSGDECVTGLNDAGVDTQYVVPDDSGPTGTASIAVDDNGNNTIIVATGVNANLCAQDIDRARDAIAQSTIVLVGLEVPVATALHASEIARQCGATVVLNPSPAQALPANLLKAVDILVLNEAELGYYTGLGSPVDPATAAGMMRSTGVKTVIVTMGERGAIAVGADHESDIPAHEVEARDSTGAGDAFVGNLAAALDRGAGLTAAMAFASAAAALSVQCTGGQGSMPLRSDTERLIAESHSS